MIRRMKQLTGFTPKQLGESMRRDEAFWYYRLLARVTDEYLGRLKVNRSIQCRTSDDGPLLP
jgi:hypothetical protein